MTDRIAFQTAMRAAAVTLLTAYGTAQSLKLQVYRARPRSISTPTAFIAQTREQVNQVGPSLYQRVVTVDIVVLHGSFDGGDEVDQRDAFVDGFLSYVQDNDHAAGADTTMVVSATSDDPVFVPDWLASDEQRTYFASIISLEGACELY